MFLWGGWRVLEVWKVITYLENNARRMARVSRRPKSHQLMVPICYTSNSSPILVLSPEGLGPIFENPQKLRAAKWSKFIIVKQNLAMACNLVTKLLQCCFAWQNQYLMQIIRVFVLPQDCGQKACVWLLHVIDQIPRAQCQLCCIKNESFAIFSNNRTRGHFSKKNAGGNRLDTTPSFWKSWKCRKS